MSSIIIVIQNIPYQSDNKAWSALRFAGAALVEDMSVRVHLLDDGVKVGCKNQQVPEGSVNLEQLLNELIECGLEVSVCGMSLDNNNLDENVMIEGVERASMKMLAGWVKTGDKVMVF